MKYCTNVLSHITISTVHCNNYFTVFFINLYVQLLERTERRAFVVELAGNRGYVEEVRSLQQYAHSLITKLSASLAPHRRLCARFHFLTDRELMALLANPTPERLNSVLHKV